jgi:hypothetical protein
MNNLTLQIKDKQIEREYTETRRQKFDNTFWPQLGFYILSSTRGILQLMKGTGEPGSALRPLHLILVILA